MRQYATVTLRVHPKLLRSASRTLRLVGLRTSDAIALFLKQIVLHGRLPFEARIPNAKARRAAAQAVHDRNSPIRENDPLKPAYEAWAQALREFEPGGRFADYYKDKRAK